MQKNIQRKQVQQVKISKVSTWDSRFGASISPHVITLKKSSYQETEMPFVKESGHERVSLNLKTKIRDKKSGKQLRFRLKFPPLPKPHLPRWEFASLSGIAVFLIISSLLISPLQAFSYFEETKKNERDRLALLGNYFKDIEKGIAREDEIATIYKTTSERITQWLPFLTKIPWIENNTKVILKDLHENFPKISLMGELFLRIFTEPEERRYLIFFQNNHEIRPTGGFLGSFLFVSLKNGKVERLEIPTGGTYDLNGQLSTLTLSPEPLHVINARWQCQDMNWFFDFPTSAQKMKKCYEKSRGETVDGVVAINASILPELFTLLGPFTDPPTGEILTSENILSFLENRIQVESYTRGEAPKQILEDLFPQIISRVQTLPFSQWQAVAKVFLGGLQRREIQLYSRESSIQKNITQLGWAGNILEKQGDYLAVVHSNIGGEKTDAVIEENILHKTIVEEDGALLNEVSITRKHRGIEGELFTGVANQDYIRVYVPYGAAFLSASGFDISPDFEEDPEMPFYERDEELSRIEGTSWIDPESQTKIYDESGKTVFGNWVILLPGEEKTATIRYRLPFKLPIVSRERNFFAKLFHSENNDTVSYRFYAQRQSGMEKQSLVKEMKYPSQFSPQALLPEEIVKTKPGEIMFDLDPFTKDAYSFIMFSFAYGRSK